MTIEANLVGEKKEMIRQANKVIRKKKCRRRERICRVLVESVSLQRLFVACNDVFKGPGTVPPPQDVLKLQHILDNMNPEDVGLSTKHLFFNPRSAMETPSITCSTIYQCKNFSLCLFFLPPTAVIPLHNHPEMTVFNKLLLGTMHIKSYDWVDPATSNDPAVSSKLRLARMKANGVFKAPCNTSVLYPTSGGNMHAFTAITACAVLDVMGPPYSKDDGRDCAYYRDFPCSSCSNGLALKERNDNNDNDDDDKSYGWLEEIEVPKDLRMDRIEYMGPQIVMTDYDF